MGYKSTSRALFSKAETIVGTSSDPLDRQNGYTNPTKQDVRVRETAGGLVVNFRCRLDAAVSAQSAHDALDEIERRTREEFPKILRIVGRAEPTTAQRR